MNNLSSPSHLSCSKPAWRSFLIPRNTKGSLDKFSLCFYFLHNMKGDRGLSCSKNDKTHYKRTIKVIFITCHKSSITIILWHSVRNRKMCTAIKKSYAHQGGIYLKYSKTLMLWSFLAYVIYYLHIFIL